MGSATPRQGFGTRDGLNARDSRMLWSRWREVDFALAQKNKEQFIGPFPYPAMGPLNSGQPQRAFGNEVRYNWALSSRGSDLNAPTETYIVRTFLHLLPTSIPGPRGAIAGHGQREIDTTGVAGGTAGFSRAALPPAIGSGFISFGVEQTKGSLVTPLTLSYSVAILAQPAYVYGKALGGQQPPYGQAPLQARIAGFDDA